MYYGGKDQVISQILGTSNGFHKVTFQTKITSPEDDAANDFILQLTHRDPLQRLSFREAGMHDYLLFGMINKDSLHQDSHPIEINPLSLHRSTPIVSLLPTEGSKGSGAGEQWARRQFSVLWAPMPSDYQMNSLSNDARKVC